jgi:hypothetical protein
MDLDDGRTEEIAFDRFPHAALAALPGSLALRDQPVALERERVRQQCAIRRADGLDDA